MQQSVYIASPESQQIDVFQLDGQGSLTRLQVVACAGEVQSLVVHPYLPVLYAGIRPQFRVQAYHIAADGTVSAMESAPLPGGANFISVEAKGRYLFTAAYHQGCLSCCPLNNLGVPQAPTQIIDGLAGCHSANLDPTNQWLWVPALKQDRIYLYRLTAEGQLQQSDGHVVQSKTGAGPRHMAFHPQGGYAYVINELDSTIDVWDMHETPGQLTHVQNIDIMPTSFTGVRWAADIHITADGRHLFACDRTSSLITCFAVSQQGALLTPLGFQPTETQPRGFAVDSTGDYLLAVGQKSDHVAVYHLDRARGALQQLERYAVGRGPMWVAIRPLAPVNCISLRAAA